MVCGNKEKSVANVRFFATFLQKSQSSTKHLSEVHFSVGKKIEWIGNFPRFEVACMN